MKSKSFVISAIILSLGGFFAKAIGALYKIPLTNVLGSSGMGLYYLVFPIYSLIITFCSSGISIALTTEVAKCRKIRHRYNEQKLLRVALIMGFILSSFFSILLIICSRYIAELQGNINAGVGYVAIAPAIILSTLIATLRGYFQGVENMVPTTISLIIEQIVKLSIGLILALRLCNYGVEYAVLGAILGVTFSEVVALIIISINFFTYKGQLYYNYKNATYKGKRHIKINHKLKKKTSYNSGRVKYQIFVCNSKDVRFTTFVAFKRLSRIMIPNTFSGIIIPISTMLDSFMIINLLTSSGYSSILSTSLYGLWGGVVQSLLSIPTIVVTAISTALVPSLSGLLVHNDTNEINKKVSFFIKISWIASILMFILVYLFADDILRFLYGGGFNSDVIDEMYYATKMLRISSISIIYYAFLQTFTSILQTIGKSYIPFFALAFSLIIRTILVYILVPRININIFGGIIANIIFIALTCVILCYFITKEIKFNFKLYNHLLKPILIGTIVLTMGYLFKLALQSVLNYFVSMCIIAILMILGYVIWIYFGRVLSVRETKFLYPRNKKLIKTKNAKNKV